ncbi:hypothetical protein B0I37DRAFT_343081 [Chaetomium sp. MPI-CAGE-AT-0009]|nr:hypothetical protein B0I37DRAFT_343081 [Chaetomium sp. MPI-CAGE-AT-0009]
MESVGTYPRPAPLETLPLHLFEYLCQYVPRRSLFSLSMASRVCYHAATPQRLSRVKLTIRDKEKLRGDLEKLVTMLGRHNLFRHVRRVVAIGCMNNGDKFDDYYRKIGPAILADDDDDSDGDSESGFGSKFHAGPALSTEQKQAQHEAWLPFAQFLGQLPALSDLVYACTHQIPPCVLGALHQHHPKSRLHIDAFDLRSLYQERDQLHDIDPDDFALATSPCLYSLRARCVSYDERGRFNFNLEALKYIVASGCAPGLRKVSIHHSPPSGTLALVEALRDPRYPWKGFFHISPNRIDTTSRQQTPAAPERVGLDTLVLSNISSGHSEELKAWNARADYRTLRCFEYYGCISVQALQTLTSMAANECFHSLRELGLTVSSSVGHENATEVHVDQSTASFLQTLPPLQRLKLHGHFGSITVEAVLRRHGSTLRKLHLLPYRSKDHDDLDTEAGHVREIQQRCPRLEHVELRVRRRQGGPEEVAVYRTLGKIPRLRRATLLLDCRSPFLEPARDLERVRKTLVNLAVDESLAVAIFHEITAATASCRLEHLTLKPDTEDTISEVYPEIDYFGKWIGRSWALTRHGPRGNVRVREIDVVPGFRQSVRDDLEMIEYQGEDVWDGLWPNKGGDWRDDWCSFPLWREEALGPHAR